MFAGFQQQDGHEFLILLLDSLHEDLNKGKVIRLVPVVPEYNLFTPLCECVSTDTWNEKTKSSVR